MAFRIAHFTLDDGGERTPSGGLKVRGRLSRTGVQVYHRPDGSEVRELRPEEEVFSADALASFRGAPLTDLHPSGAVTPETFQDVARGHIGDDVARDGEFVAATIYVQDADLIRAVQDGTRRELSAGYQVDLEEASGELAGERFDRIQRNIRGNHVAALPPGAGRAGPEVALRLDSSDNAIVDTVARGGREDCRMITIRIDGVDYQIEGPGAEPLRQALERRDATRDAELTEATTAREQAQTALEEATGRADAAEARVAELEAPATLEAAAEARAALVLDARTILRDDARDFSGKTAAQIMAEALGEDVPADASEDYLRGAFTVALKAARADGDQRVDHLDVARVDAVVASRTDAEDPMDKLEAEVAERNRNAWKAPMALSQGS